MIRATIEARITAVPGAHDVHQPTAMSEAAPNWPQNAVPAHTGRKPHRPPPNRRHPNVIDPPTAPKPPDQIRFMKYPG